MMDFISHGLLHCVIEVSKDSSLMGVGKDSGHGTWLGLISSHGM